MGRPPRKALANNQFGFSRKCIPEWEKYTKGPSTCHRVTKSFPTAKPDIGGPSTNKTVSLEVLWWF